MCFVHLRERLYIIKKGKRGTRFKDYFYRYKKKENLFTKVLFFVVVCLCWVIALILSFLPGPGFLFFFIGLSILLTRFFKVAAFLDYLEVKIYNILSKDVKQSN